MKKVIEEYQHKFADFLGAGHAFAFWKGRVALYAILKAMEIGNEDEIILPGYTCVMDVNPIKYLGAKPVYVDIEPETFNIDVDLLKQKITSKTKVIIAQHTYGYPCDMDAIMKIARDNNITVIEDCCLALGSKYKGKIVGTFGKAAYFSSQWNKPYTTGLGGMAITNDSKLAENIQSLCDNKITCPTSREIFMLWAQLVIYRLFIYPRTTAFAQDVFRYLTKKGAVVGSSSTSEFKPVMADDFFKSISSVQGRSGLRQLSKINENIQHRKKLALFYDKLLNEKGINPQKSNDNTEPVLVRYPVRVKAKNEALETAAKEGVELGSWFESPLHPIETPLQVYDYEIGSCPQAEKASNEVVNLPLHPRVNEKTARKTIDFIADFAKK
jgi:dTDP-4-amino-4,6-dideoxygalactose transaminase